MTVAAIYKEIQKLEHYVTDMEFFAEVRKIYNDYVKECEELSASYIEKKKQLSSKKEEYKRLSAAEAKELLELEERYSERLEKNARVAPFLKEKNHNQAMKDEQKAVSIFSSSEPVNLAIVKSDLPAQVSRKDLFANGLLLSDKHIAKAIKGLKKENVGKLKKHCGLPHSVLKLKAEAGNTDYYAEYGGKHHVLGKGAFGKVRLLQKIASFDANGTKVSIDEGRWFAEKNITLYEDQNTNELIEATSKEVEGLKKFEKYKGAVYRQIEKNASPYDKSIIVMDLFEGISLAKLADRMVFMPLAKQLNIMSGIVSAVKAFHEKGFWHRDISLNNLVYSRNGKVELIDFGTIISNSQGEFRITEEDSVGTIGYTAPENMGENKEKVYSEKTEIYSLGITLAALYIKIKSSLPREIEDKMLDLLNEMSAKQPIKRPTMDGVVESWQKLEQETLSLIAKFKNIGIIDFDQIVDKKGRLIPEAVIALKMFDKVFIIDKNDRCETDKNINSNQIIASLEEKAILFPVILKSGQSVEQVITSLKNKNNQLSENEKDINSYFYLSNNDQELTQHKNIASTIKINAKKSLIDYSHELTNTKPVTENVFDLVIYLLNQEIINVKTSKYRSNKKSEDRIIALETAKKELQGHYKNEQCPLTNDVLLNHLKNLEKKMCHLSFVGEHIIDRFKLSHFDFFKTRGSKKLQEIEAEIKEQQGKDYLSILAGTKITKIR